VATTTVGVSDLLCDRCGGANDPRRNFCRRCGNALTPNGIAEAPANGRKRGRHATEMPVGVPDLSCDRCGAANDPRRNDCRRCGNGLTTHATAIVPADSRKRAQQATETPVAGRPIVESFRLLALNINRMLGARNRRVIAVMSAWPNDGRSLVSASLARALSEIMPPVLLIDADPAGAGVDGRGSRTAWNGADPRNLDQLTPLRSAIRTPAMFVEEVREAAERGVTEGKTVVIDTPACTISSIGFYVASSATGVLYVARRKAQDSRVHRDIRAQLDLLGTPILGLVFNEG
jgi:ribosomal protein L40E